MQRVELRGDVGWQVVDAGGRHNGTGGTVPEDASSTAIRSAANLEPELFGATAQVKAGRGRALGSAAEGASSLHRLATHAAQRRSILLRRGTNARARMHYMYKQGHKGCKNRRACHSLTDLSNCSLQEGWGCLMATCRSANTQRKFKTISGTKQGRETLMLQAVDVYVTPAH